MLTKENLINYKILNAFAIPDLSDKNASPT